MPLDLDKPEAHVFGRPPAEFAVCDRARLIRLPLAGRPPRHSLVIVADRDARHLVLYAVCKDRLGALDFPCDIVHLGELRVLKFFGKMQLLSVQKEHRAAGKGLCPTVIAAVHIGDGAVRREILRTCKAFGALHVCLCLRARRKALKGRALKTGRLPPARLPCLKYARLAARTHRIIFFRQFSSPVSELHAAPPACAPRSHNTPQYTTDPASRQAVFSQRLSKPCEMPRIFHRKTPKTVDPEQKFL